MTPPRIAAFRPDDGRIDEAAALLDSLGAEPVPDPMLTIEPTGESPPRADFVVLTSATGVAVLDDAGWAPGDATLCCIGDSTAEAAEAAGWTVERVPDEYDSAGMVAELREDVAGQTVALARSDRASATMPEGLRDAGADVSETTLYRLERPEDAGRSAELAAAGELDGAAFTSSSTVEGFLAAAEERGIREEAIEGLNDAVVGAIADGPAATARDAGIEVDVVPDEADFEALARAVVERAGGRASERSP
ncbi:uroporphyrinogen-III synthase [Halolamina litorea]|uniref:Uroporphyrinogen-III synthase n=1 Tax=Halolamina litorea TaxID=1515593 RepID=A0ABD6BN65_9EURY|nr:uroporphyrinogen-III synthase [Halolamina litorea]